MIYEGIDQYIKNICNKSYFVRKTITKFIRSVSGLFSNSKKNSLFIFVKTKKITYG